MKIKTVGTVPYYISSRVITVDIANKLLLFPFRGEEKTPNEADKKFAV